MKRSVVIALGLCAIVAGAAAKKQRTGPARIRAVETVVAKADTIAPYDTIVPEEGSVRLSGYDKPNAAVRETFFITNHTDRNLMAVSITLTYSDMKGREMHEATHCVRADIPAGATRNVGVRSWDANRSYHYYRSAAPKRRASTPYRVASRVNFVVADRQEK